MRPGGLAWIGNRARTSLLDFVRGLNPEQFRTIDRCGSWAAARVPTLEDAVQAGNWYCGAPEGCVEYVQTLQEKYSGLEMVNASSSMGTPQQVMVEQLEWFGKEVMPAFQTQKVHA
jgi:hypothetical protein